MRSSLNLSFLSLNSIALYIFSVISARSTAASRSAFALASLSSASSERSSCASALALSLSRARSRHSKPRGEHHSRAAMTPPLDVRVERASSSPPGRRGVPPRRERVRYRRRATLLNRLGEAPTRANVALDDSTPLQERATRERASRAFDVRDRSPARKESLERLSRARGRARRRRVRVVVARSTNDVLRVVERSRAHPRRHRARASAGGSNRRTRAERAAVRAMKKCVDTRAWTRCFE